MKRYIFLLLSSIFLGCDVQTIFEGDNQFADGFESYSGFDNLFPEEESAWTYSQLTLPQNTIEVDSSFSQTGQRSVRFEDQGSLDGRLSKASISKSNLAFWEGETLLASAWIYLENEEDLDWLFLLDVEERAVIGAGPGIRVALVNHQLLIEHKYNEPNILQPEASAINFARNQWVHIELELALSQRDEGHIRLWQDGTLIIDAPERRTLPSDFLYFQQGTKGMYNSLEVGITANPTSTPVTLWVDDVSIERVP